MMKWVQRSLVLAGLLFVATGANAFPLRAPQVPFNNPPLQGFLNIVDPGIATIGGQLDAQTWAVAITGNTDFTLVLKNGPGQVNSVGVYNGPAAIPVLFQVFPPNAIPGWYAALHFGGGNLVVSLFDQNSIFMGQTTYLGVNPNNFGFYTQGPCGTWFSQDFRNPQPQMLAYASPGTPGDYWLCFEACPYGAGGTTFDGVVINVQSVKPTPAVNKTWGAVKGLYH